MKHIKSALKNSKPVEKLFLLFAFISFVGALLNLNFYAAIAWICCFVIYVMFNGEREQNKWLQDRLREERIKNLDINKSE